MKYIFILFALSLTFVLSVKCQDVEFKKKNFTDEAGFTQAVNNIKKGDDFFSKQKKWLYQQALEYYVKANEFNPNNSLLNFKIGICYLNLSNKAASLEYFLKAKNLKPNVDPKIEYAIAQGYHYNLQFDEAITHYKEFIKTYVNPDKNTITPLIEKKISECENGKKIISNPLRVTIENLGSTINSKYTDYVSLVMADEKQMIFTSRREGSTGGEIDQNGMEYFEDVYQSSSENGKWTTPQPILGSVNTKSHDASVGLSFDGKLLFIYRGLINGGDLYECKNEAGLWGVPKSINRINTSFHETSACITNDGKTMYLTSDRQDRTMGMRDIFVTRLDNNGDWSEPENLGATINTPYDEEGVTLSEDGNTLYFSSTGHNTMGGFDMFKSVLINGKWSEPENMGFPLNTPDDEMYLQVFNKNGNEHGYFSASRKEGVGSVDIYSYQFIQENITMKNSSDSTENPENYRVPIESGDPANLFVNVNNDSVSVENKTKDVTVNEVKNTDSNQNSNQVNEITSKEIKEPVSNETTENIVASGNVKFKVQVGACHRPIPNAEMHERYPGQKNITLEMHDGWYKYLIGDYPKYSEAKKEKVSCGTSDAWVVAYRDGKRVHISEVINMLSYYPFSKLLIFMIS